MAQTTPQTLRRIALIGAESTGKTALCERLAAHFNTACVPEYARTYFHTHNIHHYTADDLLNIARMQQALETEAISSANGYLFFDTSFVTLKIWARNQFGTVPSEIEVLADTERHDLYLLCANDLPWEADAQRLHPHLRDEVLEWNKAEMDAFHRRYALIEGTGDARFRNALTAIEEC